MNQLFERFFLIAFIQRHRKEVLPDSLQGCELLPQGRQAAKYLVKHQGKPVFHLRPDLVFRQDEQFPLLIDFKYKRTDPESRKLGIAESDCYQMYAYLKRFDSPRVLLIYPQMAGYTNVLRERFNLAEQNHSIDAATVNLLQDLNSPDAKKALQSELKKYLRNPNMTSLITDWRNRLTDWLGKNEKTMPNDLAQLQQDFIQRFPREDLPQLTLENYAVGKPDTFCYWIEFKTHRLGSVAGGSSSKWGIYWSKSDQTWKWNKGLNSDSAEEAF